MTHTVDPYDELLHMKITFDSACGFDVGPNDYDPAA